MPSNHLSVSFDGWSKAAVVLDADGTFDVHRLQQLLLSRLSHLAIRFGVHLTELQLEEASIQSLKNLHIFRPSSSTQLAATVLHLDTFHETHLSDIEIGLLAVDSISAFYWQDRFTFDQLRSGGPQFTNASPLQYVNPIHHLLSVLQRFRISHGSVIVLTNWGLNAVPDSPFYKQHLHPFPVIVSDNSDAAENNKSAAVDGKPSLTHHITIPFIPIIQLQPSTLVRGTMSNEVEKGQVVGIIRTSGSLGVGQFSFEIRETELLIGDDSAAGSDPGIPVALPVQHAVFLPKIQEAAQ